MPEANTTQTARQLLTTTQNRATQARIQVLDVLLAADAALSHHEIEQQLQQTQQQFDRVTVYRTLDWLVKHKLAHRIAGQDRSWRYNAQAHTSPRHAHFFCKQCSQILCLEQIQPTLLLNLPEGYQLEQAELNLQGYCPHCSRNNAAE